MRPKIKNAAARKLQPQAITTDEINAILRRLQAIDNWSKAFGCRMGLVGESGFKVFRYLAFAYMAKGWACFPSYRWIANKTNMSRSTVTEALKRLKRLGALNWEQRRVDANGKRVQGSNLFTIALPAWKARLLPVLKRVRNIREKAADGVALVANVAKSVSTRVFSETGYRSRGVTTLSEEAADAAKACGAPAARSVSCVKAVLAVGSRTVCSEESGTRLRQERAFARFAALRQRRQQAEAQP